MSRWVFFDCSLDVFVVGFIVVLALVVLVVVVFIFSPCLAGYSAMSFPSDLQMSQLHCSC